MSDKRQKNQLALAFTEEGRSEAPKTSQEGTESRTAKCETERPASHEQLMEEVCERENCWQAYKRVKANKGSPGIDGMKVGELSGYLKQHWPSIREQLLRGTYKPQPMRRVEIPKPDGGVRKLGILLPPRPFVCDDKPRRLKIKSPPNPSPIDQPQACFRHYPLSF
jgi:RNA-directed DNA polymerase